MQPAVSYITYITSPHEQTDDIITFAHIEQGNLVENEHNTEQEEWISSSIDELYADVDSDYGTISTNAFKEIWDGRQIHPYINASDAILRTCDPVKQTQNEWKGSEISEKSMGKVLHKVFKAVVN